MLNTFMLAILIGAIIGSILRYIAQRAEQDYIKPQFVMAIGYFSCLLHVMILYLLI